MKANELRIGNWVIDEHLDGIGNAGFWRLQQVETRLTEDYEPIPLTEEILLKCGFEYNKHYDSYVKETDRASEFIIRAKDFVMCDIDLIVKLKHLHQLQNLYFALTGEELNIEL